MPDAGSLSPYASCLRPFLCYAGSMKRRAPELLEHGGPFPDRRWSRPLLAWYDRCRRDLPWRRNRDPYAVWISEIMLQQTQVKTVEPYYRKFLGRFPGVQSLARAPLEAVLKQWAGLGYYRRAEHLHAAARMIVSEFGGELPPTSIALRRLPGVGRSTAAAIASIAFDEAAAVLDGNVVRVLCRRLGVAEDPARPAVRKKLEEVAQRLVPRHRPGDYNQAMMELGATLCTPVHPACPTCPVKKWCLAFQVGEPSRLPRTSRKPEPAEMRRLVLVLVRGDRVLMLKRPGQGLWAGLWEFPAFAPSARERGRLAEALGERLGLRIELTPGKKRVEHRLTHRTVSCQVVQGWCRRMRSDRVLLPACDKGVYQAARWVRPSRLGGLPVSALTLKIARASGIQSAKPGGLRA
jgi:A/G-specific adenine glycosylase